MPRLRALLKSPPLAKGDAEQQLEELRDYLLQIVEELGYLLTHIEADNINDTTFERISQMIPKAFTGAPSMDGEGSPGTAPTWARGDHTHPKDSSKADVTALAAHIADRLNPHAVTKAQVGLGNVADERQYSAQNPPPVPSAEDVGAIPATEKGSAGGVAELDANGMVPSAQLPSYVDDVLEYASLSVFPVTGESGKIYVALDTNKTYRWSGSAYVEISESLALGETSSTAYRGDRGKAAYDHSQLTSGNPHNVTAAEAGAVPTSREVNGHALSSDITLGAADVGARADTWMPTASDVGARPDTWTPSKSDIGLGNVDNVQQYSASNPPPYPVTSVNGSTGAVTVSVPSAYASNPAMDGTASPGSSNDYARGDHVHPSDTSKANQAQLAYVETGTTASRNYTVGEYFCWNGLLYRVKTAISSGGTFTPGTNCEQVTEGAANSLKSEFDYKSKTTPTVYDASRLSSVSGGYVVKGNVVYIQMQFTVAGSWSIPSLDTFRLFSNFPAPQFGALLIASGNGNNALWNFNFLVRADGAGVLFNRDAVSHNVNGVTFTVTGSYIIA